MLPSDLLIAFREEMADKAQPYLWPDDFIIGAIDDAQKQFARKTDGIPDSTTSAVVDLVVAPDGSGLYSDVVLLDPRVLKIRSARRGDNGREVEVLNEEDMPTRGMYFDSLPGRVRAMITGMDETSVRVWPFPNEDVTIKLSVFRLPLVTITDDEPLEIPLQHHLGLLLWMKHRAYSVHDAETYDKTKAADFKAEFETYCTAAKTEQRRLRHKPRTVAYGGI
ncbi:MAG TPA: hypothetical protein PK861_00055 [Thermomonas sp.]|nr:hypothetical protein [Thermomonas sp.]